MGNRNRKLLVPESREAVDQLKGRIMNQNGYHVEKPEDAKFEVAKEIGVPLDKGYNGELTSKQAGKVGGNIGGSMVKEMVKLAEQQLNKKQ
jgi:small acid-soluble spore protein D (minor alpha/beta-type SASP)